VRYESGSAAAGVFYALAAFGIWGAAPLYWKAVEALPASELLGHRIVWSCAVGVVLISATRAWPEFRGVLASRRLWLPVLVTALVIGCNWFVFLWAVLHDQVLATSLGYYITPLVNVLLGVVILRERLRPWQIAAVALAAAGVLQLALSLGELPWVTLALAFSFGIYGLLRKLAPVQPVVGFGFETLALAPLACAGLAWLAHGGRTVFPSSNPMLDLLVIGSGVFTAAPLICFNSAAKRLRLSTLGLLQYIAPSITFLLAVALYDEPFTRTHALAFGCVWVALTVYSLDALRRTSPLDAAGPIVENPPTARRRR
jgi:chloramphenicol-sensitive protein RarD